MIASGRAPNLPRRRPRAYSAKSQSVLAALAWRASKGWPSLWQSLLCGPCLTYRRNKEALPPLAPSLFLSTYGHTVCLPAAKGVTSTFCGECIALPLHYMQAGLHCCTAACSIQNLQCDLASSLRVLLLEPSWAAHGHEPRHGPRSKANRGVTATQHDMRRVTRSSRAVPLVAYPEHG